MFTPKHSKISTPTLPLPIPESRRLRQRSTPSRSSPLLNGTKSEHRICHDEHLLLIVVLLHFQIGYSLGARTAGGGGRVFAFAITARRRRLFRYPLVGRVVGGSAFHGDVDVARGGARGFRMRGRSAERLLSRSRWTGDTAKGTSRCRRLFRSASDYRAPAVDGSDAQCSPR